MAKRKQDTPPTCEELATVLRELLEWERHLGGWEAEVWKRAYALDRRLRKDPLRPRPGSTK